jgi:hypothetical protein
VTFLPRDGAEIEALVTDRYLESLLSARDRRATDAPSVLGLDPAVRTAAARLSGNLTRVHPSFRFEERLAARLAQAAARMTLATAAGAERDVAPIGLAHRTGLPDLAGLPALDDLDPVLARLDLLDPARPEAPGGLPRRPLIIGGTIASAALSIAGAAFVAWRLSHPADPMTRAARAAHSRRDRPRLA